MSHVTINRLDADGTREGVVEGWESFRASIRWRDIGSWQIVGAAERLEWLLTAGCGVSVRVDGQPFLSGPVTSVTRFSDGLIQASGVDDNVWLQRRLALTSGTSPLPESLDYDDVAETVIYQLVGGNAGPSAGVRQKYVLTADEGRGGTQKWKAINQPLLDIVRQIVLSEGWGFRSLWDGPGEILFTVLVPRDRTAAVRFSDVNGSLSSWERQFDGPTASTVYVAGAADASDERPFVTVTDASDWGSVERFVDHREAADDAAGELTVAGESALADYGPLDAVDAVSRPIGSYDARDWRLGDLVTVEAGGVRRAANVVGVDVVDDTVSAVLSDGRRRPVLPSLGRLTDLERRMARQEIL